MITRDKAGFSLSIGSTLAYPCGQRWAASKTRYCIGGLDHRLRGPFLIDFSDLELPFDLLEMIFLFYFSSQYFMCFEVILLDHLFPIGVGVDEPSSPGND